MRTLCLLALKLAHGEISIVGLRIFTQLFYEIGSLHLYFFSGYYNLRIWILNSHEAIWWRPIYRFLLAILVSAHTCNVYVELHIRWYDKSLLRNILLILCRLKTVKLGIRHGPESSLKHIGRLLWSILGYAWRNCFRINLLATKLITSL